MKLTVPPFKVEPTDGFKNDIFNREPFAEKLTNLIVNTDDELVIALDAAWGEGKTTFVKMWQGMLINDKKIETIYFDAFKNDFLDDPFLALVGEIYSLLDSEEDKNFKTAFKTRAVSVLKVIGKTSINIGLKALTAGAIDETALDGVGAEKDFAGIVDKYMSERLESLEKDKNSIEHFQNILQQLAEKKGKIIFIIDELDRCKPSFALDLIEKIKHIFSIPNIAFVLVMNKEQIDNIVKARYGLTDSSKYLQKFIHIWASLPKNTEENKEDGIKYLEHCLDNMGFEREHYCETYKKLISHYNMSLRDIERSLTYYSLIHNILKEKNFKKNHIYLSLLGYLSIIKVIFPNAYKKVKNGNISYENLIEQTNLEYFTDKYFIDGEEYLKPNLKKYITPNNSSSSNDTIIKNICSSLETLKINY